MLLERVFFDAYKSLLGSELELGDNCIGLVGRNESGKSNVLAALASLSPANSLRANHSPKMGKGAQPALRFVFALSAQEKANLLETMGASARGLTVTALDRCKVTYNINFDKKSGTEHRSFSVQNVSVPVGYQVRKPDRYFSEFLVATHDGTIPLDDALLLTDDEIALNAAISDQISSLSTQLEFALAEVERLRPPLADGSNSDDDATNENQASDDDDTQKQTDSPELSKAITEAEKLRDSLGLSLAKVGDWHAWTHAANARIAITETARQIDINRKQTTDASEQRQLLSTIPEPTDVQKKELTGLTRTIATLAASLKKMEHSLGREAERLKELTEPIQDKYHRSQDDLNYYISMAISDDWLPPVVFWESKEEYILKGETEFKDIKSASSLDSIPRPLVNLFRIGLGIRTLDELKDRLEEVRTQSGERSRYAERINKNISAYLKSVWPDYDQQIRVSLERDRMRVEFYDPLASDAGHYTMEERSQGCQTFLSFLMTVGAEAKHGVIRNAVLLLDEPETRLHPSGVRFMLQELIRAAAHGNKVVYATHSVFMIDRDNYDRHVILKKENERTVIQPSKRERIGFFMQEEVLYAALDFSPNHDFRSLETNNFVFEGDGDAILFESYYSKLIHQSQPFKYDTCGFYQGGKCTDIQRYFTTRQISISVKWIFIIDADKPATELKRFLEGKYRDYVGKNIFVFQYQKEGIEAAELEDLIPTELIGEVAEKAANGDVGLLATIRDSKRDAGFAAYFAGVLKAAPDEFKANFKSALNQRLRETTLESVTSAALSHALPTFTAWVDSVLAKLRDATTKKEPRPSGTVGAAPV